MYAVIKTGGKQYRVAAGEKIKVEQIPADVGSEITIDQVFMVGEGESVKIGTPVAMQDSDFTTVNVTTSAAQKMDQIAARLSVERGTTVTLIKNNADRQRANGIPFRGNPTDVKTVRIAGQTKAYVPLGGDPATVGNEIGVALRGVIG